MSQTDPLPAAAPTATTVAPAEPLRVPSPAERVQASATRAATGVPGVHALGSPAGRALVRTLGRVPGGRVRYGSGVSVELGPDAVALDLSLVLENGRSAVEVADQVRRSVRRAVSTDAGLRVVEVNVTVADLHDPADDVPPVPAPEPTREPEPTTEPDPATEHERTTEPAAAEAEPEPEPGPEPEPTVAQPDPVADQIVVAERVVVVQAGDQPTG